MCATSSHFAGHRRAARAVRRGGGHLRRRWRGTAASLRRRRRVGLVPVAEPAPPTVVGVRGSRPPRLGPDRRSGAGDRPLRLSRVGRGRDGSDGGDRDRGRRRRPDVRASSTSPPRSRAPSSGGCPAATPPARWNPIGSCPCSSTPASGSPDGPPAPLPSADAGPLGRIGTPLAYHAQEVDQTRLTRGLPGCPILPSKKPSPRCSPRTARSRRRRDVKADALVTDTSMYDEGAEDFEGFWARQAAELLDWETDWHTILEWDLPYAKWFVGGRLNVAHNCLDRHVAAGRGEKVAIHFEGEPGDTRTITYAELLDEVQRFANVLKSLGIAGGRPGQHLPADDPRGRGGDARVCTDRCPAQRRVRWVLRPGARRSDQRRRGEGADHRRRRTPSRRDLPAQAGGRRGGGVDDHDRARRRRAPGRERRRRWSTGATTGTTS